MTNRRDERWRGRARRGRRGAVTLVWAMAISAFWAGCTIHHSKQALWTPTQSTPTSEAAFITEEDSGLSLFGIITLSEPDHYAVLLERARRRYKCSRMHHAQLDFFTDYWILVAFPVSRITLVCEPGGEEIPPLAPAKSAPQPLPTVGEHL